MDTLHIPADKALAIRLRQYNLRSQSMWPYVTEQRVAGVPCVPPLAWVIVFKTDTPATSSNRPMSGARVSMGGATVPGGVWALLVRENAGINDPVDFDEFGIRGVIQYTHSDPVSASIIEDDESSGEISAFLDKVYDLARCGKEEFAIDVIFEYMNTLLVQGEFGTCDRILAEVDIGRIPPVLMVSFLTITAAAASRLKNRKRFYQFVRALVARERGEKAAERLLDGLE